MEWSTGYIDTSLGKILVHINDQRVYTEDWMKFSILKKLVNGMEKELTFIGVLIDTDYGSWVKLEDNYTKYPHEYRIIF